MWIDGFYYTEPELRDYIARLKKQAYQEGFMAAVEALANELEKMSEGE